MSASAQVTGGELIVRCLAAEGVRFVFGLPCPEIEPILAVLDQYGLRFVPVRHEAAAVHMAEGVYKTTGGVAAVIGNPGPGSANLLPGIVTARHEGVPVVAITAQHRLGIVYPSPPSTFQGQDQLDLFKPTVKWGGPLLVWERIPEVFRLAFREMWTGRPGPVHIEAPMPVIFATGDADLAPVWPAQQSRPAQLQPSRAQIEQAADMLAHAEHPLVISGSGVDRANANAAVLALVELLACPVVTTMAGRGTVPCDHPSYIYGFGHGGDVVRKEADVIVVVGSRLGNLELPYDKYWGPSSRHRIIQIDVDPRHIAVTRPVTLGIVADARVAVEALVDELRARGTQRSDRGGLARYREADAAWWIVLSSRTPKRGRGREFTPHMRGARRRRGVRARRGVRHRRRHDVVVGALGRCRRPRRGRTRASWSWACWAPESVGDWRKARQPRSRRRVRHR